MKKINKFKKLLFLITMLLFTGTALEQTIVFTKNFERAWTTPSNLRPAWSGTTTPADNVWHQSSYTTGWASTNGAYSPLGANSTTASARFHSYDAASASTGDFITPTINLSAYTAGSVKLDFYHINTSGTDVLNVYVSNDDGTTWSSALSPSPIGVSATWTLKTITLPGNSATTKIKFTATSDYGTTDIGIDEISVYVPLPMTYTSSTTNQVVAGLMTPSTNQAVIKIPVITSGTTSPLNITKFTVNANGTTNIGDISNAKLFYTGASNSFAATNQFGTTVASPTTANFDITGTQTLASGVNYFWLTFDINSGATIGNLVDGECTAITVGGVDYTPTITAPIGARTISGPLNGVYTIDASGSGSRNFLTFSAAIADLNALGISGPVTFNVAPGFTETFPSATSGLITTTGTLANPIIFQKSGVGTNPVITAGTGTSTTVDGIIVLKGVDYITFDGINLQENPSNTTATTQMEWGYALVKASATDGAQNNEIKNCVITLNKANTSSAGIYFGNHTDLNLTALTLTNITGANSNNKINGNTVSNAFTCIYISGYNDATPYTYYDQNNEIGYTTANTLSNYGGASTCYAIYLRNNNGFKISNNNISCTGATSTLRGIYLASSTNASGDVNNNNIQLSSSATTSQMSGIESAITGTGTLNILNNNIHDVTYSTATTGVFYGIYNSAAIATVNINGNIISNISTPGTGTIYGIETGSPTTVNVNNNSINNISKTGIGYIYCIKVTSPTNITANGNTIDLISQNAAASTGSSYGFYSASSAVNVTVNNNIIRNFTCTGAGTNCGIREYGISGLKTFQNNQIYNLSTSAGGTLYGAYISAGSTIDISSNQIYALNTIGGTAGIVYGIWVSTGTTVNMYKNSIYNLSNASTGALICGFYISGGTTDYLYNNMVSDLKAPAATGANAINGIYITGGTTVGAYYNTLYLDASSTGTTFGSSGIYKSSTTTGDFRNNIIVNVSAPGSTSGYTVAYRWSGAYNATYYAATSNNNCFYAGTPATNKLIFYDGTNSDQTIDAYKSRVSARDAQSFTENPPFLNVTTAPYNLHLSTTIPTLCESAGTPVTTPIAVPVDFDNDTRNASNPDVGADEGPFIILNSPPVINYTALDNTISTADRTLVATITDPNGVGSGVNQPVLYWKINTASSYTGPIAPTSIAGNQYTFTFGSGVAIGDVVSYFIVAQDNAGIPMAGSYPSGATCTTNPPLASVGPAFPSTYLILGLVCGDKTVGTGGDYTTFTAAINALNTNQLCGPITFSLLNSDYSTGETFPLTINPNPGSSATNTITFKPATGIVTTISGSVNNGPLLKVLGNSNVIFDGSNTVGGTTRDLTISNTSTTSPQVLVIGSVGTTPITNVTVKNCNIINGVNTSSAFIISDGNAPGAAGYFNNITVQNNTIQKAYIGLYSIAVVATGNGSGLNISNNDLTTSGANSIRTVGLYVQGVDGATLTNNNLGNFDATNAEFDRGIWLATSTINSSITGNTVTSLGGSGGGGIGIYVSSGAANANVSISDNIVHGFTTSTTYVNYGIYLSSAISGVNITKNNIYDIKNTNTGGYSAIGIALGSSLTAANTNVSNNLISDIAGYGYSSTTTDNGFGINILSGGGYNLYYNSVNLATNQTSTSGNPACLIINSAVTTANCLDIRNNIFSISSTVGANRFAVLSNAANTVFSNLDYNDYYTSGPNLGYLGSNQVNIAAWRTATGKDVNSFTAVPVFVSATNAHLVTNGNCVIDGKGTPIVGFTTDIDGDTRNATTPDPGADEFTTIPLTAPVVVNQATCFGGTIPNLTATVNGTAKWYTDAALTNLVYTGNSFPTGQTAVGVYAYYVIDSLGTCLSAASNDTLRINDNPAQPSAITGSTSPCIGASENYSVTNVGGISYAWTFPTGWTQTAGGTTNSITVTVGSGSGDITCTPSDPNCTGTAQTLAVTPITVPDQPSAITGNTNVPYGSSQNYSVTDVAGVTYTWTFPTGWTQTGGGTTNSITVTVGAGNGDITCTPSNTCGNGTPSTLAVTVSNGIPGFANNIGIFVNPNPTNDLITITLNGFNDNINLQLQNVQGKTIYSTDFAAESTSFNKTLDLSTYQKGIYFLRITSKGITTVNKIVLQ